MEEESSWCANCQRDIPTVNFVMHSMHCSRNITLCRLCQEPVPRTEVDAHQKEFHSVKECESCGEKMDINLMEKHKIDLCPARKITCSICELDLPASDMVEHENYCGSRTELCDECGEYVMLKYQKLHIESNHGFLKLDDEPGPTPSWQNNERATANGFDTVTNGLLYKRKVTNAACGFGFLERNPLFMSSSPSKRTNDMPQVNSVPPPHSSKSVYKAGIMDKHRRNLNPEDHVGGVAALLNDNLHLMRPSSLPQPSSSYSQEDDLVALPCEFCEALVPANQLILHQTACRPDLARLDGELSAVSPQTSSFSDLPNQIENLPRMSVNSHKIHNNLMALPSLSSNGREGSSNAMDDTMLPCEFCHKSFSAIKLYEHQTLCTHTWSEDLIQNGEASEMDSSPINPQQNKKSEIGRAIPLEPGSSVESAAQSFHRSHNNEMAPGLGSSRKLLKEDLITNVVRHNNFHKDIKTKPTLYNRGRRDLGHNSLEKERQYPKTTRVVSWPHSPNPLLPVYNEFKEDEGRLALLNKAKAMEAINSHIERNKDDPSSQRNHVMKEMAKQFSALHRQPGHFSGDQSSSYGLGSYPSSSNHPQPGRGGRTTGAIPKQKAGKSKSPLAF